MLTLIASARLHVLEPEAYLRDVIRVVPRSTGKSLLLAPDVCIEASCTAPDALSLGLQVKAVPATINGL